MVNTLFASKVMYVNQLIIMFSVCCHRLAESGFEWQGRCFDFYCREQKSKDKVYSCENKYWLNLF